MSTPSAEPTLVPVLVPLDLVAPNPWQMRLADDPAHVADLAESIRAQGLLQIPTGRPAKKGPGCELAFGHSRLAAYRLLGWEALPVYLRPLTDREMSDLAAAENARRKNLSAIETATALKRRIEDFKLSHAQAGAPFGLSDSAVSNLLRLLRLPAAVQAEVGSGQLPERLARQLVNVAPLAPQEVERIGKAVAKADPAEREQVLREDLGFLLEQQGLSLDDAPWAEDWLKKTTPADAEARAAGVETLRACRGCPHRTRFEYAEFCTLPACFAAKLRLHVRNVLDSAVARLGIPAWFRAGEGEKPQPLLVGSDWQNAARARLLVKAFPKQPELALRLVQAPEPRHHWREVVGDRYVGLATLAPQAVAAFLKAHPVDAHTGEVRAPKAKALQPAKDLTPAQAARQKEREAAEAEQRREARAAKQRALHDCAWLIQNATPIIARQLALAGPGLAYVVARVQHAETTEARLLPGLDVYLSDLTNRAWKAALGKERDQLLRECLVAEELVQEALPRYSADMLLQRPGFWEEIRKHVEKLATATEPVRHPGFGVKLPAGWDKPPVHRTPYNCWQCGRFTGAERVTKRDEAAGWIVAGKAEKPDGVWCSQAHQAAYLKANPVGAKQRKPASPKTRAPARSAGEGKRK